MRRSGKRLNERLIFRGLQPGPATPLLEAARPKNNHKLTKRMKPYYKIAVSFFASAVFAANAAGQESPSPTPTPTPPLYSSQTISELKQLQQAALKCDYAYGQ